MRLVMRLQKALQKAMPKARLTIGRGRLLPDKEFHIVAHQSAVIFIMSYQQSISLFHDNRKRTNGVIQRSLLISTSSTTSTVLVYCSSE